MASKPRKPIRKASKTKKAMPTRTRTRGTAKPPVKPRVIGPYTIFNISKKSGGTRIIEAPNDELKAKQRQDLRRLETTYRVSKFAHAFRSFHSIATMANPHSGQPFKLSMDIKDFFPSISLANWQCMSMAARLNRKQLLPSGRPVKFKIQHAYRLVLDKQAYNRNPADTRYQERCRILGVKEDNSICMHFQDFGDGKGIRLPQGAPASPFLANVYLYLFDGWCSGLCARSGTMYTRYADDLVISGDNKEVLLAIYYRMRRMLAERFYLTTNDKKTRVESSKSRQKVCGLVINKLPEDRVTTPRLPRRWLRRVRAALHQQGIPGWNGKDTEALLRLKTLDAKTRGKLSLVHMVAKQTTPIVLPPDGPIPADAW